MSAFEKLERKNNRYVIDSQKHAVLYNPKQNERKKYNLRVNLDGEIFYFKGNGYYSFDISELFCAEIAKQAGLKTINPVPAYFVDENGKYIKGILSKDYVLDRPKTEVMSGYNILHNYQKLSSGKNFDMYTFFKKIFTKEEIIQLRVFNNIQSYKKALIMLKHAMQKFNANFKLEIDKDIMTQLGKYLIFYFLTNNEDCYANNIEFVFTKSDDRTITVSLAPLTDNSISLLLKSFKVDYKNFQEQITDNQIDAITANVLEEARMPFSVFEKSTPKFRRESVAVEIAKIIEQNPVLKEFYTKLKSIDLTGCLKQFRKENDYKFIKAIDIKVASSTFHHAISQLEKGVELNRIMSSINNKIKTNREKE